MIAGEATGEPVLVLDADGDVLGDAIEVGSRVGLGELAVLALGAVVADALGVMVEADPGVREAVGVPLAHPATKRARNAITTRRNPCMSSSARLSAPRT